MTERFKGLKQFFPGAPDEWVQRLVESDDNTDELTGGGGQINVVDNAAAVSPIRVTKTQTGSVDQSNPAAIDIEITADGDPGIAIHNSDNTRRFQLGNNGIFFVPKDGEAAPAFYSIGVRTRGATDTEDGGNLWINAGTAQNAASTGGNLVMYAGFGGAGNGVIQVGPFNTAVVEIGAASVPVDIKGELTIGGVKFLVVTANPDGSVTAPRGSLATNTTDGALYSNTDGGTTWVAR